MAGALRGVGGSRRVVQSAKQAFLLASPFGGAAAGESFAAAAAAAAVASAAASEPAPPPAAAAAAAAAAASAPYSGGGGAAKIFSAVSGSPLASLEPVSGLAQPLPLLHSVQGAAAAAASTGVEPFGGDWALRSAAASALFRPHSLLHAHAAGTSSLLSPFTRRSCSSSSRSSTSNSSTSNSSASAGSSDSSSGDSGAEARKGGQGGPLPIASEQQQQQRQQQLHQTTGQNEGSSVGGEGRSDGRSQGSSGGGVGADGWHGVDARADGAWSEGESGSGRDDKEPSRAVLKASLPYVLELGWTEAAMLEGVKELGLSPSFLAIFPRREAHLVEFFMDKCRTGFEAEASARAVELEAERSLARRLALAIRMRLEQQALYTSTWPQAMSVQARPVNLWHTAQQRNDLVAALWAAGGERTRSDAEARAACAVVGAGYTAAELFMLTDFSPGFEATWQFLQRQADAGSQAVAVMSTIPTSIEHAVGDVLKQAGLPNFPLSSLMTGTRMTDTRSSSSASTATGWPTSSASSSKAADSDARSPSSGGNSSSSSLGSSKADASSGAASDESVPESPTDGSSSGGSSREVIVGDRDPGALPHVDIHSSSGKEESKRDTSRP